MVLQPEAAHHDQHLHHRLPLPAGEEGRLPQVPLSAQCRQHGLPHVRRRHQVLHGGAREPQESRTRLRVSALAVIISAIAAIILKSQQFNFFQFNFRRDFEYLLKNLDNLFGSEW